MNDKGNKNGIGRLRALRNLVFITMDMWMGSMKKYQDVVRKEKFCNVANQCGACDLINTEYSTQLAIKDEMIREMFASDYPYATIRPIMGMSNPYHYRNKVTSPFMPAHNTSARDKALNKKKKNRKNRFIDDPRKVAQDDTILHKKEAQHVLIGMFAKGTHRIVATEQCFLENEKAQEIVRAIRSMMERYKIEPYDENRKVGFMRHVVVRIGHKSQEVLVTLVTNSLELPSSRSFCRELVKRCPYITSIVQNVNLRNTNVILGNQEKRLYGPGFILDDLCGLRFRISSQSFYQVNATQTERLYECAVEMARLSDSEVAFDAYCGTGTIGLVAAKKSGAYVIGFDSVASAIKDARENARHNGIKNAIFFTADADQFMSIALDEFSAKSQLIDVLDFSTSIEMDREDVVEGEEDPLIEALTDGQHDYINKIISTKKNTISHPNRESFIQASKVAMNSVGIDVIFLDPPRSGATPQFIESCATLNPSRIVYISCNPISLQRDLRLFVEQGYKVEIIQPVDMFPHTNHVETVVLMSRQKSGFCEQLRN